MLPHGWFSPDRVRRASSALPWGPGALHLPHGCREQDFPRALPVSAVSQSWWSAASELELGCIVGVKKEKPENSLQGHPLRPRFFTQSAPLLFIHCSKLNNVPPPPPEPAKMSVFKDLEPVNILPHMAETTLQTSLS